jgi:hypothetical protein
LQAIPEPSNLALLSIGLACGMVWFGRRRSGQHDASV